MRGLEEVTGDVGGAAAALWDNCQESNMRPWRGEGGGGKKEERNTVKCSKPIIMYYLCHNHSRGSLE